MTIDEMNRRKQQLVIRKREFQQMLEKLVPILELQKKAQEDKRIDALLEPDDEKLQREMAALNATVDDTYANQEELLNDIDAIDSHIKKMADSIRQIQEDAQKQYRQDVGTVIDPFVERYYHKTVKALAECAAAHMQRQRYNGQTGQIDPQMLFAMLLNDPDRRAMYESTYGEAMQRLPEELARKVKPAKRRAS